MGPATKLINPDFLNRNVEFHFLTIFKATLALRYSTWIFNNALRISISHVVSFIELLPQPREECLRYYQFWPINKDFLEKKMSLGVIHRAFIIWKKKYLDQLKLNHYVVCLQLQNVRQPLERSKGILEYLSFETKLEIFSNFEMLKVNVFEGKMSETWFVEIPLVKASTSIEAHRVSGKMRDRVEHFYVSSPSLIHLP